MDEEELDTGDGIPDDMDIIFEDNWDRNQGATASVGNNDDMDIEEDQDDGINMYERDEHDESPFNIFNQEENNDYFGIDSSHLHAQIHRYNNHLRPSSSSSRRSLRSSSVNTAVNSRVRSLQGNNALTGPLIGNMELNFYSDPTVRAVESGILASGGQPLRLHVNFDASSIGNRNGAGGSVFDPMDLLQHVMRGISGPLLDLAVYDRRHILGLSNNSNAGRRNSNPTAGILSISSSTMGQSNTRRHSSDEGLDEDTDEDNAVSRHTSVRRSVATSGAGLRNFSYGNNEDDDLIASWGSLLGGVTRPGVNSSEGTGAIGNRSFSLPSSHVPRELPRTAAAGGRSTSIHDIMTSIDASTNNAVSAAAGLRSSLSHGINSASNSRSLLYDSNSNHYLPQELSSRPVINPLIAAIDVIRLARPNANILNGVGTNRISLTRSTASTSTSSLIGGRFSLFPPASSNHGVGGILSALVQSTLSNQSQSIPSSSSIFNYNLNHQNSSANSVELGRSISESPENSSNIQQASLGPRVSNVINNNIRSYTRVPALLVSTTRRQLGPIVSDRRWGVDIGNIQCASEHVNTISQILQSGFTPFAKKLSKSVDSPAKKSVSSNAEKGQLKKISNMLKANNLNKTSVISSQASSSATVDPAPILQESQSVTSAANTDLSSVGSNTEIISLFSPSTSVVQRSNADESKEEGELQESKEPDDRDIYNASGRNELNAISEATFRVSTSTESGDTTSNIQDSSRMTSSAIIPPGVDPGVWEALPLEMQIEMMESVGLDATPLLTSVMDTLASSNTNIDRSALLSLPRDVLTQVLAQESNERKRKASFDLPAENPILVSSSSVEIPVSASLNSNASVGSGLNFSVEDTSSSSRIPVDLSNNNVISDALNSDTTSLGELQLPIVNDEVLGCVENTITDTLEPQITESTIAVDDTLEATSSNTALIQSSENSNPESGQGVFYLQENIDFVNSLSYELRQEVLVSAEEDFLLSLTPALQSEATNLRAMFGIDVPSSLVTDSESNRASAESSATYTSTTIPQPTSSQRYRTVGGAVTIRRATETAGKLQVFHLEIFLNK